jgi:DNA-binding CsgD family transcriptional regulator/PAS domain-containing protein
MPHATNGTHLIASERLSKVVGAIYDCAIDPERWRETLRELCVDLRCMLSAIYLFDAHDSSVRHVKTSDAESEAMTRDKDYLETMVASLRLLPVTTQPLDEPIVSSKLASDYSEFIDTRFFKEVSVPRGHGDGIHVVLARNSRRFGLFSATRHMSVGLINEDDCAIMRLFAPHIRRAVTISDLMELKLMEAQALSATLDRLATGVVVVAGENRILHANEAARRMFADGGPIVSRRGRLAARDAAADAELSQAIQLSAADEAALAATGIGIALGTQYEQPALAHVLPLARGEVRTRLVRQAAAAVFINTPEARAHPDLRAVAKTYGLTPAEARVVERLLAGANLADVAASLDVSLTTVKTHLSQVFAKTGASRQSDLIALMHRMMPPALR